MPPPSPPWMSRTSTGEAPQPSLLLVLRFLVKAKGQSAVGRGHGGGGGRGGDECWKTATPCSLPLLLLLFSFANHCTHREQRDVYMCGRGQGGGGARVGVTQATPTSGLCSSVPLIRTRDPRGGGGDVRPTVSVYSCRRAAFPR